MRSQVVVSNRLISPLSTCVLTKTGAQAENRVFSQPPFPLLLLADSGIPQGSSSESEAGHSISNPNLSTCVAKRWGFTEIQLFPGLRKPGSVSSKPTDLMRGGLYCTVRLMYWCDIFASYIIFSFIWDACFFFFFFLHGPRQAYSIKWN